MDKPRITPKDFFLWAGAMIALYWSVIAFIFLVFNYIDYALPNALQYYTDPYQGGMPYEMASLIVLLPVYAALKWALRKDMARDPSRREIWVRRWALIFTLFLAGVAMAIDLVTILTKFLSGEELTAAFLLKAALIFLVAAGMFMHFIADLWGFWDQFPPRRRAIDIGVTVLIIVAIVAGFFIVGTPQQARLRRLDDQKINDLQTLQYQIVNYWQYKQVLPSQLSDLNNPLSGISVPADPQSGASYGYRATGPLSFELCADFNELSRSNPNIRVPQPMGLGGPGTSENWQHGAGHTCFERAIDTSLYPPIKS